MADDTEVTEKKKGGIWRKLLKLAFIAAAVAAVAKIVKRRRGDDLDDHAFDVDLGAARVELVDHRADLAVQRLGPGNDQRIGRRVGLDEAAGAGACRGLDR